MGALRTLAVLILVGVLGSPFASVMADGPGDGPEGRDGPRGSWTVHDFVEQDVPVNMEFLSSTVNSTYHIQVPNSGTVTSASLGLRGLERYSLKGTSTDFNVPGHGHSAYWGENGRYPPVQAPSFYDDNPFGLLDEDNIARADGIYMISNTPIGLNPLPYHWSYHLFDMVVDPAGLVRLRVQWQGAGYNPDNTTRTHGADMYAWNYTGNRWLRLDGYSANDTAGQTRTFVKEIRYAPDFTDNWGHVYVLVFGQHDERNAAGGFPFQGRVITDYVSVTPLVNDTLEQPKDVQVSIGGQPPIWSHSGAFTTTATLGDGEGLRAAIQSYVDTFDPAPHPVLVPLTVRVGATTWGMVRVTSLVVGVREVANEPPEFLGNRTVTMTEDVDYIKGLDLWNHFDDDYNGHELFYNVSFEENASAVSAEIHPDGHSVNFVTVAEDWAGTLTFRFNGTDVWGLTTESTDFTLTVTEVNDPPVLEHPGDLYLDEDTPFMLNLTVVDPDLPYGDEVTFEDDSDIIEVDPVTGTLEFTPSQEHVGNHQLTVTVRDARGASDSITIDINVSNVNDPPIIDDPGTLVAWEGSFLTHDFTFTDEDGDTSVTWDLVGGKGSMTLGVYNGRFTWTPESAFVGMVNVSVIAMDPQGSANQLTLYIEVRNLNDPPMLDPLPRAQLTEGVRFTHVVTFTDPDLEVDPEEAHTISVDPPMFQVLPGGMLELTPTNEQVGVHRVNVTVTDAGGLSHTLEWEVSVLNVNQGPVLDPVEDQVWREDEPAYLQMVAHDPDVGDGLTFSDNTALFAIDARTGVINFTPLQHLVGEHDVRVKVTDAAGLFDEVFFRVTILPHNDPPTASIRTSPAWDTFDEGDTIGLAAEVDDPDNDRSELLLTWFLDGEDIGSEPSVTLRDLRPGDHTVELRVGDGDNSVSAFFHYSVREVEEPFAWGTWAALLVVLVVVVVVLVRFVVPRVWKRERGLQMPAEPEPEEEWTEEELHGDGSFQDWRTR